MKCGICGQEHEMSFTTYNACVGALLLKLGMFWSVIQQSEKVLREVSEDEGCSHGDDAKLVLQMIGMLK